MSTAFAIQRDYPWIKLTDDFALAEMQMAETRLQGELDTAKLLSWATLGWNFTNLPEGISAERAGTLLKDAEVPLQNLPNGVLCFDIKAPILVRDKQDAHLFTIVGLHPGNPIGPMVGTIPHVELRFEDAGQQLLKRLATLAPG
jgi:hypothetical protein